MKQFGLLTSFTFLCLAAFSAQARPPKPGSVTNAFCQQGVCAKIQWQTFKAVRGGWAGMVRFGVALPQADPQWEGPEQVLISCAQRTVRDKAGAVRLPVDLAQVPQVDRGYVALYEASCLSRVGP